MNTKYIENIKLGSTMMVCFLLSFIDYNGAFFVISFPVVVSLIFYKEKYFLCSYLSILIAALLINKEQYFLCLLIGLLMTIIMFIAYKKSDLKLPFVSCLSSFVFGLLYAGVEYFALKGSSINLFLIPTILSVLTYNISKFIIGLKSKDEFSFTQTEWLFLVTVFNFVILQSEVKFVMLDISLVMSIIFVYCLTKINTISAFLASLISVLLYMPNHDNIKGLILLLPLIFIIRFINKNKKTGFAIFFAIGLALSALLNDYNYVIELLISLITLLLIPNNLFRKVEKYIVDPKDYKIQQYRETCNKIISKDKKINSLIKVIETKIKDNPRMKKKYNEKIAEDLNFLISQNQSEPMNDVKEKIIEELKYLGVKIIGIKKENNIQDKMNLTLEIRYFEDYKKIIDIIEKETRIRINIKSARYNFLTNTIKYEFISEDKYSFDYFIKQRSVDSKCGDNYLCFKANNKKYFLISDGMGHGDKASEDSKFALFLLKNFIELGMDTKKAIESCNALVYSKSDTYNTLDLLEYDCYLNDIILYKNGSGNTYIQYKDKVDKLVSENLPLGIIDEINVKKLIIRDNVERIILTSDGINKNLTEVISRNKNKNISVMVNEIFDNDSEVNDDQTIMAINVIKK